MQGGLAVAVVVIKAHLAFYPNRVDALTEQDA